MAEAALFPVILSGGSGTRLWPLSRSMYPKQFIQFHDDQGGSLLGATLKRLKPEAGFRDPILLCNNDHRFLVKEELERAGIKARAVILEPVARNTAPAIAVAAIAALQDDPNAILIVMPSDHAVLDEAGFLKAVTHATKIATRGKLVLFGIKPDNPATGYGYIKQGAAYESDIAGAYLVDAFVEKPDAVKAARYLKEGVYTWNSGIFVLNAKVFMDELKRFYPEIAAAAATGFAKAEQDLGFTRLDKASFSQAENISIDYAVMEKTRQAVMVPIDVGWNDVGSWSSLWDISKRDADGNFAQGAAVMTDTTGSYIHSSTSLVATIGVHDLIIVDTPDALLVADKSRAQDVSKLVSVLRATKRREHEQHLRNVRPWGFFETLSLSNRFQVKLLHVKPGAKLSMQMHHHRSEHWVVVQGTAKVVIGDREQLVRENESVYIQATQWHRLENPGKVHLELIEVQLGSYLGEDDILRTDDVYNRTPDETK